MISVAVVEDRALVRASLRALVEADRGLHVEWDNSSDRALGAIRSKPPRVVLLSTQAPTGDTLDIVRRTRQLPKAPEVLVLAGPGTDAHVKSALAAGAGGYLPRDSTPGHLSQAIHAVARHGWAFSPSMARTVIDGYLRVSTAPEEGSPEGCSQENRERLGTLTARERRVLALVGDGLTNREIADRLGNSPETVKDHVRSILVKLDTDNRIRAAAIAWRAGLRSEPGQESA
ncbi:response regulator transcription factor [Streptomyces sp. NPDC048491]|uniref:response regulator transcription factor n=1 Tax=unclassified Streptomyces TaxID=2593676 RepID=UPI001D90BABC|nr:response regulator transcription factor [Streptomyces sp. MAG02]